MTREEIKDFCDMKVQMEPENEDIYKEIVKTLEQEPKSEWQKDHEILKAYSDGANNILDKIREIVNKWQSDTWTDNLSYECMIKVAELVEP